MKFESRNVIYLIFWKCCSKQYVRSATGFKETFSIHKSDINTGKVACGMANHLLNIFCSSARKLEYLQVQLTEKVSVQNDDDIDKVLREKRKILASALFKLSHGLNNRNEWYALNRRDYRKKYFC